MTLGPFLTRNFNLQEHQILKEERILSEQLSSLEKTERTKFSHLSTALRDSHEKERAQAEKTKYWSVFHFWSVPCHRFLQIFFFF